MLTVLAKSYDHAKKWSMENIALNCVPGVLYYAKTALQGDHFFRKFPLIKASDWLYFYVTFLRRREGFSGPNYDIENPLFLKKIIEAKASVSVKSSVDAFCVMTFPSQEEAFSSVAKNSPHNCRGRYDRQYRP
jgi:hypothetical protein